MTKKLHILLALLFVFSSQNADAQLFKRLKKKAQEKARNIENKVFDKVDKETDKTIDDIIEGKKESKSEQKTAINEKDLGDISINHSKKFGKTTIDAVRKVSVSKTNEGYTIRGNWWSHEADIYDGFILTIKTDKVLDDPSNTRTHIFKIPEEATLKLGYDPQLVYNKEPENGYKRAVSDDYQNYNITKGEIRLADFSKENIQLQFSGAATLKEIIRKANDQSNYTENMFNASVTGEMKVTTSQFINEETIITNDTNNTVNTNSYNIQSQNTTVATPGTYQFTHETVTKLTVPKQNRTYNMSYLLNPSTNYVGIKMDMSQYSDDGMTGESVIVLDDGNTHIFVETAGMKMRMSNKMAGSQNMQNPTDQMANYDYSNLKKTGNTKTILGATCHEYKMSDQANTITLWIAPSIKLPNWFAKNNSFLNGYIMEYTLQSKEGTLKSEVIAIKDNISKTIKTSEYKKMF